MKTKKTSIKVKPIPDNPEAIKLNKKDIVCNKDFDYNPETGIITFKEPPFKD